MTDKLEVKFAEKPNKDDGSKSYEYVIVNGFPDTNSYYLGKMYGYARFYDSEVIDVLTSYSFKEIGQFFTNFAIDYDIDLWENYVKFEVICDEYLDAKVPSIKIDMQIQEWEHWDKPWSMSRLAKCIESNVFEISKGKAEYWQDDPDSMLNGFGIIYYPSDISIAVKSEIEFALSIVEELVSTTNSILLSELEGLSVLTYFQFPEEIKAACKQYLVYFAQFMADVNVFVDVELKEELDSTLFKVIPKDKEESLEKIRQALNIYTRAPSTPGFEVQLASQNDIAARQWESNIYHLKSQLALAASINQAHQATIEMLQLSNYQYKQLLESQQNKKQPEKEDIIEGIVSLKSYEGHGFSIDFAEILRRLKRKFSK